jgi:hypothetical protein
MVDQENGMVEKSSSPSAKTFRDGISTQQTSQCQDQAHMQVFGGRLQDDEDLVNCGCLDAGIL